MHNILRGMIKGMSLQARNDYKEYYMSNTDVAIDFCFDEVSDFICFGGNSGN